jgi:hypothetical protein
VPGAALADYHRIVEPVEIARELRIERRRISEDRSGERRAGTGHTEGKQGASVEHQFCAAGSAP